jgi:hypothetical protein
MVQQRKLAVLLLDVVDGGGRRELEVGVVVCAAVSVGLLAEMPLHFQFIHTVLDISFHHDG